MKLWKTLKVAGGRTKQAKNGDIFELEDVEGGAGQGARGRAGRLAVQLERRPGHPLGIILASRSEPGLLPTIAGFREESSAAETDRLAPGDRLRSVNGIAAARLSNDEVLAMLHNVQDKATLEIEYYLPDYASQSSLCVAAGVARVAVERGGGSLGVTLRAPASGAPLAVTHVRPGGPAAASARIKPGDRLLKVDSISLANKTLVEAYQILQNTPSVTNLTIEYDISIMDSVKFATGPLLVEIERGCNENLGIILSDKICSEECFGGAAGYENGDEQRGIFIESIIPASISDRCGALHPGDQILAIDDSVIENTTCTPQEVMCYLENCCGKGFTQLQILPVHMLIKNYRMSTPRGMQPGSPSSGLSTLNSRKSHRQNRQNRQSSLPKSFESDQEYPHNNFVTGVGICRSEVLTLQLEIPPSQDSGITVCEDRELLLVSHITHQYPAYRSGCIQLGDRIVSINSQQNLTAIAANEILQKRNDTMAMRYLNIKSEFSMADSVEASSGVFSVKLAKNGAGLGVTITGSKQRGINPEEPMMISNIKVGSVAYRSGTLAVGDHLIAIDSQPLHNLSLDAAFNILQNFPDDIITLTIRKTDKSNEWRDMRSQTPKLPNFSYNTMESSPTMLMQSDNRHTRNLIAKNHQNIFDNSNRDQPDRINVERETVFDLELIKHSEGPLGLTIAGSEDASQPIVLSGLIKGGLAERSGALQVGDRILSINSESLHHKPLSDAIKLLQNSTHRVQLKVARRECNSASSKMSVPVQIEKDDPYVRRNSFTNNSQSSPGLASIDSAVESWDSQPTTSNIRDNNALGVDENSTDNQFQENSIDNRLSYLPTDENKLLASGYRIVESTTDQSNDLPMPNYSFTNTLRTFKIDKTANSNDHNKPKFNERFNYDHHNHSGQDNFDRIINCNNDNDLYSENSHMFNKPDSNAGSCKSESSGPTQYNLNPPQVRSSPFKRNNDNISDNGSSRSNNVFANDTENNTSRNYDGQRNILNIGNYQLPTTSYQMNGNQIYDTDFPGFYNVESVTNQGTIHHVTLYKDVIYDDYGFSVSDGLYERGVYINRIRKGGPADIVGLLRPYDRILQVNGTRTVEFDCCLTVPLIASAGDRIELVLQRLKDSNSWSEDNNSNILDSIITKTI